MPELPEVETTRRGIAPHVLERQVEGVVVRQRRLRWPIPAALEAELPGRTIDRCDRRAKYLLLGAGDGTVLIHLGMSGSLRIVDGQPPGRHDHFDLMLAGGLALRLTDPRRFGAVLWTRDPVTDHPLLRDLGPEPLGESFDGEVLYRVSRARPGPVKQLIMDARVVVGVGNIYASEALFEAGIHPSRPARRVGAERYRRLAGAIRQVLEAAIAQGGTTLRDFVGSSGQPGYFAQALSVYGREGEPCRRCRTPIRRRVIGQRSTFFCPGCQR